MWLKKRDCEVWGKGETGNTWQGGRNGGGGVTKGRKKGLGGLLLCGGGTYYGKKGVPGIGGEGERQKDAKNPKRKKVGEMGKRNMSPHRGEVSPGGKKIGHG